MGVQHYCKMPAVWTNLYNLVRATITGLPPTHLEQIAAKWQDLLLRSWARWQNGHGKTATPVKSLIGQTEAHPCARGLVCAA